MAVMIMHGYELYQYSLLLLALLLLLSLFFNLKFRQSIKKCRENENVLIKNAYYHPLTSLPNKENIKMVISEHIQRSLRHKKSFLVMLIRIKNFHEVQLHSQELAEEFIIEASNRLLLSTRNEDIIGQISDDSFLIVFNEYLQEENYNKVLQRVKESFIEPPELNTKYNIDFKVAVGTCKYPDEAAEPDQMIEKARKAAINAG